MGCATLNIHCGCSLPWCVLCHMVSSIFSTWNFSVTFCIFSHDAPRLNWFSGSHSAFARSAVSRTQRDDARLGWTTSCASRLRDYSSELNAMQAACGRWLCETLMKADKHHKPVGSRKHQAGNREPHSSLHCSPLRHPPWRPRSSSLCWLQKAQGSLRGDLRGIARRKHN